MGRLRVTAVVYGASRLAHPARCYHHAGYDAAQAALHSQSMVESALAAPVRREVQTDGRFRCWARVTRPGEARPRFLRVVTLEDGETVHNAFFDRNFREDDP
jgi:hypothetical protein